RHGGDWPPPHAPEWTRTTTRNTPDKALNLARLPNSATGAEGASIAPVQFAPERQRVPRARLAPALVSVLIARYSANTCSSSGKRSRSGEMSSDGSDQTPARDIRLHPQVLREVRLSAHGQGHRQSRGT